MIGLFVVEVEEEERAVEADVMSRKSWSIVFGLWGFGGMVGRGGECRRSGNLLTLIYPTPYTELV